ncbi:MAG: tRNA (adenosine(37)-N6)-threonylcarbamoyltransferase complex ATPase subunit type 1 TsaE [bacterium]|nr:tRNA (adenosine(37)-N6)-threonylcarbamoyltransferase complex ATPase subunit type 1 TsaE [bacterium]
MKTITTKSLEETEEIAKKIGANLKGGETIELVSDIGGGKTTFTKSLAAGAGSKDHVTSPTFTISNIYESPKFKIVHFDFYRLPEAGLIEHTLHETLDEENDVTVVEWADVVEHVLPKDRLTIVIKSKSDEGRELKFKYPNNLEYLLEGVN